MVTTGACSQVVLYGDGAVREIEVLFHDGQARPHAANIVFHRLHGGREPGDLRLILVRYARALVGETDGIALVQDGHGSLGETRVDEVFRYFADDGVRNGPSGVFSLFINFRCKAFNEFSRRRRVYLRHARGRCEDRRTARCALRRVHACSRKAPRFHQRFHPDDLLFQSGCPMVFRFQIRYSAFFSNIQRHCSVFSILNLST